jgi:hypothetical protein
MAMTSISWMIRLCGVVGLGLIIFASLMLPAKWQQLRTGHWAVEHFLAYFAATSIICLGWGHPFVVVGMLIMLAASLEALQNLQPNHPPNILAALSGAGGALVAALVTSFII